MFCTTLLSLASCLILSLRPMQLRASYVLMGGWLREGVGPSSLASREEAAYHEEDRWEDAWAKVMEGNPPSLPCRITSLVGRCNGQGTFQ